MPTTTGPSVPLSDNVVRAVKFFARQCALPALYTLTVCGDIVRADRAPVPADALTADAIEATLADLARLIARYPAMFTEYAADGETLTGYAVILTGERVAFAVDRIGVTHHVQLPGAPTEPLRSDRWGAVCDGLTTMINAAAR